MTQQYKQTSGFTLVELMLSMAFVGILLVVIGMTTIHIMGTYTKGVTVREVNQAGRTISEDIQRTIATTSPFKVTPAKTGDPLDEPDVKYVVQPGGGRLCTGAYTYAWNYGNTSELGGTSATPAYNTYVDSEDIIRLVKVSDAGGVLCAEMTRDIERGQAKDFLLAGDRNLAVQEMTVSSDREDKASGQALYAINFVIGTNDQEQIDASHATCLPPSEGSGFEEFCAINQFSIIARAGNTSGSL